MRLVVVMACDSANAGILGNELGSVAQAVHRAGVETVVASRFPLSVEGSTFFAETFYHELLGRPASVEAAFLAARERLTRDSDGLDWAGLQLYSGAAGESGADGANSRPVMLRPFRGLLAFRPEHGRFLFGRDAEINEVVSDLQALVVGGRPRFLVVSGASGTGKSSMVLGGAVPRLLAQNDPRWKVLEIRPGSDPAATLAAVLSRCSEAGRPLLLVVDQFEEIFTQTDSVSVREMFVRELWSLATAPDLRVSVIVTMRVDFLGRCGEIALDDSGRRLDRVAYDEAHRVFVPQMAPAQIEAAITRPAQLAGLTFEPGLREQLLGDVGAEPGALPLLEDTLDMLWQRRDGRTLTHAVYRELGGAVGALHGRANALIDSLSEAEREVARRIFVQLVSTSDGVVADVRRRVPLDALGPRGAAASVRFLNVVGRLVDERLLVRDEKEQRPTLEVAHEALIRTWTRLQHWVKQEREAKERSKRRRLVAVAMLAVIAAVILAGGVVWAVGQRDAAIVAEVRAGTQTERARDASLMAGTRELLARGQLAPATRLLLEVKDPERARGWVQLARQSLAAGIPELTLRGHLGEVGSVQWSPDGQHVATTSGDGTARVWRSDGTGKPVVLAAHTKAVMAVGWSPDGRRVATASMDGTARVWNADGTGLSLLLAGHADGVSSVGWSPDGRQIATASVDKTVRVWNADGADVPLVLAGHEDMVFSVRWSPDGRRVATASRDQTARVWNADGTGAPLVLSGHKDDVLSAAWSPDGLHLVTASTDETARVWNSDGTGVPLVLSGHTDEVLYATWSPDGRQVLTASVDETARVWSSDGTGVPLVLSGHSDVVLSAAWSPDGRHVVTASFDKTARVWSSHEAGEPFLLSGHEDSVFGVTWSPDGRRLATASMDKTARLWRVDGPGEPVVLAGHSDVVVRAVWSPDGRRILTRSGDGVRVWNADQTGEPGVVLEHTSGIMSASWSPDGRRIVTSGGDTARVWRADGIGVPVVLLGHTNDVIPAAWNSDGLRILTTSKDGTARIWNADGTDEPVVLLSPGGIQSAAWSPDGMHVAIASGDKTAIIWKSDGTGEPLVFKGHDEAVVSVAWSSDGRRLVTASVDQTARVWNTDGTGEPVVLRGSQAPLGSASWSPDDLHIVTVSWADEPARVWSADGSGAPILLKGHEALIASAEWSPNSQWIVTASLDRTARVWPADGTGEPLVLKGHSDMLQSAAWSPDGLRIVTASSDRTARIWSVSIPSLRQALRNATRDCLTPAMRRTYLDEADEESGAGYDTCERSYGREPAYLQ